jgi:hypothetical protein
VDRGTDPLDADDDDSPIADLCGAPLYGASSDRGTFVWKDCDGSNRWHMRVTGGGVSGLSLYEGRIDAPGGLLSLVPVSIEASDVLDQASNPDALNYSLRVYNIGEDGFDFEPPPNACLRLNGPAGLPVFLGQGRVPLQRADLDLDNGGPCGGGPGGELPVCGAPLINDATDKEAFLWRNCSTGKWSARFNAGTSFTIYEGTIESAAGFTSLQGVSVEDSDTLTGSASDVFFNLRVGKTFQDGFDFTAPEGSDLCVDLDLPEGIDVLVGANRLPVTPPFDPLTLGACN